MRNASAVVAVLVLAAGCGGGDSNPGDDTATDDAPAAADARPIDAAPPVDAGPCTVLDDCSWLADYQREIVGKLAGELEIAAGTTITRRASNADRTIARDYL